MLCIRNPKRSLKGLLLVASLWSGAHAQAATGLTWANGSDLLAIGLPALAAGSAWGQNDKEGFKQLTLSIVTTVGTAEVLKRAQEIDERETKMLPFIREHKALSKAVSVFNRI